jgi:neutral ceramidase
MVLRVTRREALVQLGVLAGFSCARVVAAETGARWKAGVSREVITPETPVWLAGYGSRMKALALEAADGARAVLITSDFQGVPRSMSDRVFAQLKSKFGLTRAEVMFTFSHNHCGPRLGDDLIDYYPVEAAQEELVREYTDRMVERTVKLVGDALSRLEAASVATGMGRATFAVNRRNNPEAEVPKRIAEGTLVGPVDHDVPVMRVDGADGRPLAIVFGYACHPTTLSFTQWCGDYPGFAQSEVEKAYPGATAMFVNTCGGDQNPLPRRTVALCQSYGHQLAVGVLEALKEPLKGVAPKLKTAFELIELPYLEVMTREQLEQFAGDSNAIRARWAKRLLRRLDDGATFESASPYPLHAWRLGDDTLMLGMGAETVVDYAIRFKNEYGPGTWVCGYTDDMLAYIPSRRVWDEGGYEGGWNLFEYGRPALRWSGDVETRITEGIDRLVREVRGSGR